MSIKLMSAIFEDAIDIKGAELLVLLALSDHADDDGKCWPSLKKIAHKSRISVRQVQRCVSSLEEKGYLRIQRRKDDLGRPTSNVYHVRYPDMVSRTQQADAGIDTMSEYMDTMSIPNDMDTVSSHGDKLSGDGDKAMSTKPSVEPSTRKKKQPAADAPKLSDHPCVKAYHEQYGKYPNRIQMQIIADHNPPLEQWKVAIYRWAARDYRRTNIEGMLEWAFHPEKMERQQYSNGNGKPSKMDITMENGRRVAERMRANGNTSNPGKVVLGLPQRPPDF